ncbi:MAG: aminomethyl-transferring glycine dehydrogenase [Tannerellaceae bacterium]|jgi:glycine dehydrogenase|nr:aminomethyl-transferring glycine dehydrogenase [Tannerellaceae bacterium]
MDTNKFINRHAGIAAEDLPSMLQTIGVESLDQLIDQTIPEGIRLKETLRLPEPMTERECAEHLAELGSQNQVFTSYIGMGWYDTVCPAPIQRNVLENPVWYTSYTPYQAEVSQGRLEALLNFQTVICELTGLPLTNCSLLDEATAGAEAVSMLYGTRSREQINAGAKTLFVDENVFESTRAVIQTRMIPQGIRVVTGNYKTFALTEENTFGAILQYPDANGSIEDYKFFVRYATARGIRVAVAADLLSLVILSPPGEWGADVVFGSAQRFGIPMFYGGPSAGYMATKETYKRAIPGRIIGLSKDAYGHPAYRLALQTREQHIKREKATSNICTAQALLATLSGFYAVYHGAEGLKNIARRIHAYAGFLSYELEKLGYRQLNNNFFDTLKVELPAHVSVEALREIALECRVNLRYFDAGQVGLSLDETTQPTDIGVLLYIFAGAAGKDYTLNGEIARHKTWFDARFARTSSFLQQEVFKKYRTETELMRYITRLGRRDISLAHSMIPLGSCTMKLNAASELFALSSLQFQNIHPYAPEDQTEGYSELIENLSAYLAEITGLEGVSLQPNSGASGEYAGLRVIRSYQESIGEGARDIVLLPASAHGTNPASAIQCGYATVTVKTDAKGNIDLADFRAKAETFKYRLAATMITYPSTHGIFEADIREMCQIVHACGGQVYMDGANMNAQLGLTHPGAIGADVCHLNLHKTFASPHGGGGPGVGPICVASHLKPFLTANAVASAPYGSAGILPITYAYIRLLGAEGLTAATRIAILNANYLAAKLKDTYGIVYTGTTGRVGHELILECRTIKERSGIDENDIAKRLMDFGYHAPTLSFPVHGTLMIEPTESESKAELDRFVEVLDCIREEIREVEEGQAPKDDNVLKNAPHPEYEVTGDAWPHVYSREKAAFPLAWLHENKFWLNVARIDNAYGDRNLAPTLCDCPS